MSNIIYKGLEFEPVELTKKFNFNQISRLANWNHILKPLSIFGEYDHSEFYKAVRKQNKKWAYDIFKCGRDYYIPATYGFARLAEGKEYLIRKH